MGTLGARKGLNGRMNPAGLLHTVYIAPVSEVVSFATPDVSTNPKNIVITADHTFDPADGFTAIEVTADSASFEGVGSGVKDSHGRKYTLPFFMPGNFADQIEFINSLEPNNRLLVLVKDRNGKVIQFGASLDEFATAKVDHKSGKFHEEKGFQFTIEADVTTPFIYEGNIQEHP